MGITPKRRAEGARIAVGARVMDAQRLALAAVNENHIQKSSICLAIRSRLFMKKDNGKKVGPGSLKSAGKDGKVIQEMNIQTRKGDRKRRKPYSNFFC